MRVHNVSSAQLIETNARRFKCRANRTHVLPVQRRREQNPRADHVGVSQRTSFSGARLNRIGEILFAAFLRTVMPHLVGQLDFHADQIEQVAQRFDVAAPDARGDFERLLRDTRHQARRPGDEARIRRRLVMISRIAPVEDAGDNRQEFGNRRAANVLQAQRESLPSR